MIIPVIIFILGVVGASARCSSNYIHHRLVYCMDPMVTIGNHVGDAALRASCNAIQHTAYRLYQLGEECPHDGFVRSVLNDFTEMSNFMNSNFC